MANNKLLTAEEILQMSDDDYMDERQLAFFRNLLVQMENELRQYFRRARQDDEKRTIREYNASVWRAAQVSPWKES